MKFSIRAREWVLVGLVTIVAIMANLPQPWLDAASINRNLLLGLLALTVFIALFLYLKFQFFMLVVLLALGANMPSEVSESLGISTLPLVIAMALVILVAALRLLVRLRRRKFGRHLLLKLAGIFALVVNRTITPAALTLAVPNAASIARMMPGHDGGGGNFRDQNAGSRASLARSQPSQ